MVNVVGIAKQKVEPATDERAEHWLRKNFSEVLDLPEDAENFLIDLYKVIQLFDDVADEDHVSRNRLDAVVWASLVGMPGNAFYVAHAKNLIPVLATQILKWQASDRVERSGNANPKSYMWRAGYYDVVLLVIRLCHGYDKAMELGPAVMTLYAETLNDYLEEFGNA
jgi:hypothetical protein